MPRGEQVGRWFVILEELRAARVGVAAEILARRHGWNPRTVYRDLRAIEAAGFPVTASGGRWRMVEGWQRNLPIPLTLGERIGLGFARRLMSPLHGTRVARDFEQLYERLAGRAAPVGERQGQLFARLEPLLSTPSQVAIDYAAHTALIETLCTACETQRTVRAVYYSDSRRALSRRGLDPYHLHWDPRLEALYVFAWCHLRKDVRTFAVHRFRQVTLTTQPFTVPPSFAPERHLRGAFRIWRSTNAARVRLVIDPSAAGWIAERRWHASQTTRRRPDGSCELELTVDPTIELSRFILQLGAAVEVLEPATLRRAIAAEHAAAARLGRKPARRKIADLG